MIVNVDLFGDCAGETYFVRDENTKSCLLREFGDRHEHLLDCFGDTARERAITCGWPVVR
jgi:hypothetical protein